ncbi:MAG TPA: hypothetical protein PK771_00640 [Spirochaetota bacterium]|mgnify:CR=1 FL=1|nr:hypothetical protein [Spirochaetota bacterium]
MHKHIIFLFFLSISFYNLFPLELTDGYKDIKLGMSKEEVSNLLKKSFEFDAKREEVLSIRLEPDTEIITAKGFGFINVGYFHFNKDKLFQIFIKLNEKKIDYYALLKNNTNKYGNPKTLDPERAIWENSKTKIVIEKPATIKYLFLPVWNELIKKDHSTDDLNLEMRNKFLENL